MENLPYGGQSPADSRAFSQFMDDARRGKSLLQLMAIKNAVTPVIYKSWSPGRFTSVMTPKGSFDAVICTISYHFNRHGEPYGSVSGYTHAAQSYLRTNRSNATLAEGKLKLPNGWFETDGRILTFW